MASRRSARLFAQWNPRSGLERGPAWAREQAPVARDLERVGPDELTLQPDTFGR
jgi:hypothetical protein